jgi:hypothetical protein
MSGGLSSMVARYLWTSEIVDRDEIRILLGAPVLSLEKQRLSFNC